MSLVVIGHDQSELQRAFCEFVPKIFRRASFQRWCEWGQWADDYLAFAWIEEGVVLANASLTRMQLLVEGEQLQGWQLGAVGCLPDQRARGLARACLDAALQTCGADPVLLFANPTVREFYPRFGFAARGESMFTAEYPLTPAALPAPVIDLQTAAGRAELAELSQKSTAVSRRFAAVQYSRITSWYAANQFSRPLWRLAPDVLVFAGVEGDTLFIDDIVAVQVVDLRPLLPMLIDQPVHRICFGFTPDVWWPDALAMDADPRTDLFVRHFKRLPRLPHKFPLLAQT